MFKSTIKIREISGGAAWTFAGRHNPPDCRDRTSLGKSRADLPRWVIAVYAANYFKDESDMIGFCWRKNGDAEGSCEMRWSCRLDPSHRTRFEDWWWDESGSKNGETEEERLEWRVWNERVLRYFEEH
jgi:hypothetical protein